MSLHLAAPVLLFLLLGIFALRVFFKTIRIGLLLAAPALLYLLHTH